MLCKFADFFVEINPLYDYTKKMIKYFETDEVPTSQVITLGEKFSDDDYKKYNSLHPEVPVDEAEHIFLATEFFRKILKYNAIMIHSSAIKYNGKCYLFSADSGIGKSTHTSLWQEVYGDKVQIINDDKPIIRIKNNKLIVYGSPFAGGTMKFQNDSADLGAIVFLERSKNNSIEELSPQSAMRYLFKESVRKIGKNQMNNSLNMISVILENCKFYKLKCNMDKSSAILSRDTIVKED